MLMKTLVIPTVGISNVPQLVVQKLLSANTVSSVTKLDPTYLYPYVTTGALVTHTPLELHTLVNGSSSNDSNDTGVVQLHSPVLPGYEYHFAQQINEVVSSQHIGRIIVIDSKDKGELTGWEWYSSDASLEAVLQKLTLEDNRERVRRVSITETCPLVRLLTDVPVDYYAVRVYEGPNEAAINQMAKFIATKEKLIFSEEGELRNQ